MIKKVFYTFYQPYLVDAALKLNAEKNWKPVYWFTEETIWADVAAELKIKYPETIFHNYNEAIKGKWAHGAAHIPLMPLDVELLNTMSTYESTALSLLDRNDLLGAFTYNSRVNTYHDHLQYWNSVLEYLKPDLILLEAIPHQLCDFIIFRLAKLKGIKTLMFNMTFFLDSITTMEDYETGQDEVIAGYKKLIATHANQQPIKLSQKTEDFIRKFLGKYEENLRYDVKEGLEELAQIRSGTLTKISREITGKVKQVFDRKKWEKKLRQLNEKDKESLHSQHKKPGYSFAESTLTNAEYNYNLKKANKYKQELLNYYNQHCEHKPDLSKPFIYCPLHLQPEATTCPLGGHFVNQLLMVRMLSASIPDGWFIYVKEHMAQFIGWFLGEPIRSKEYYQQLSALKNVKLISLDIDSYTLVDKCKAAATVTGTICLEGTLRGKHVLAFGSPINYHEMEGVTEIRTNQDLKRAIDIIQTGHKPDMNKVKLYAEATHLYSYRGGIGTPYNNGFMGINRNDNAKGHYNAVINWLQKNEY